jgi:hypothetical protein
MAQHGAGVRLNLCVCRRMESRSFKAQRKPPSASE